MSVNISTSIQDSQGFQYCNVAIKEKKKRCVCACVMGGGRGGDRGEREACRWEGDKWNGFFT